MTETDMKRLNTWERKILRRIYGPVVEQGIQRIRSNHKLWDIYKDLDTVADMKRKDWYEQDLQQYEGRAVKKIFDGKPEETRRRERRKLRWLEDVEKDLSGMKVMRWWEMKVDRKEQASIFKKARAVRGPYSQGVSK